MKDERNINSLLIMAKNILFNYVKERNTKQLYETIYKHLYYLFRTYDPSLIKGYQQKLATIINGYTLKDSLFKDIVKQKDNITEALNVIQKYTYVRLEYLKTKKVSIFSQLEPILEVNSPNLYFLFFIDNDYQKHLNLLSNIAKFDALSDVLINIDVYKKNNLLHLSNELLFDYKLENDLKDDYLKNESFKALWNLISIKVLNYYNEINTRISILDINVYSFIKSLLIERMEELKQTMTKLNKKSS